VGIQTLSAEVSGLETEIEQKLNLNLNVNLNVNVNLNLNDPVLEQLLMVRVEITLIPRAVPTSFNFSNNASRIEKCPPCLILSH
jgi:hypothetical protein